MVSLYVRHTVGSGRTIWRRLMKLSKAMPIKALFYASDGTLYTEMSGVIDEELLHVRGPVILADKLGLLFQVF